MMHASIKIPAWSLIACGVILGCACPASAQMPDAEYIQPFKGPPANAHDFALMGPEAQKHVKFEADGLRITLPTGHAGVRPAIGIASRFGVQGDFEITVSYEVLAEPTVADAGSQTRFALALTLDKPNSTRDQVALNRRVTTPIGTQFFVWLSLKNEVVGKFQEYTQEFPANAKAKSGRLRIVRDGAELSCHASEGDDAKFVFLEKIPFGAEDLRSVGLVAATGGPKAALDVRVTDLRIRAVAFRKPGSATPAPPPLPAPTAPAPAAPPPPVLVAPPAPLPPPVLLTPPAKKFAREYHQSLKTRDEAIPGFTTVGPGNEQHVKFEADGLRITLPTGWKGERPGTGARSDIIVKGDFEITLSFEILREPAREDAGASGGSRLNLGIVKESPTSDVTTISRTASVKSGSIFFAWSVPILNAKTGRKEAVNQSLPTQATTGRLRLIRSDADLYYGASEGLDGEFKFFAKHAFGPEDVRQLRIIAVTGGDKASFDVRVSDLRIRSDDALNRRDGTPLAATGAADAAPPTGPTQGKGWLTALVLGLATLLSAVALGTWMFLRRRGSAAESAPTEPQEKPASLSAPTVALACSGCGKKLKLRAELAGRKVKCPQCGTVTLVPGPEAGKG